MAKQRKRLLFATAVLMLLACYLCAVSPQEERLCFRISSDGRTQKLSLWKGKNDTYCVFLPGYAKMEQVQIALPAGKNVSIHGVLLEDGMTCGAFSPGIAYPFSGSGRGGRKQQQILFLQSGDVAALYLDTRSGNLDYIHKEKGNQETGNLTLYRPDGTVDYSGEVASIQGRGNATWTGFAKKPYSITLGEAADLLHLGSGRKWVLLANANDLSHMRNKLVFDFAAQMGLPFSPGSDWVELYLNGDYAGLYLLSERNEVHPERVNLTGQDSFLVSAEAVDRLDAQQKPYVSTEAKQCLRLHYPEAASPSQLQELERTWQSLENAILAEDGMDPVTGKTWMEQIDLDSWVQKYLMEEVFGNYDGGYLSQFFYRDGTGKIHAGPVWDYDNTMGLPSHWQLRFPNMLYANRYAVQEGVYTPWFHALYQKEPFYARMVFLYRNTMLPLLEEYLYGHIAHCSERIAEAAERDRIRWNTGDADFSRQAASLQKYLEERTAFLNAIWIEGMPYHTVKVDNADHSQYGYFAVFPGQTLTALKEIEESEAGAFLGWYDADTGKPVCLAEPVTADMAICARRRQDISLMGRLPVIVLGILFSVFAGIGCYRSRKQAGAGRER